MSKRQVANIAAQAEYKPDQSRQVANIAAQAEYKPGKYRQVANIAVQVEYVPCDPDVNDPRYAEWVWYYERLAILVAVHGRSIDLSRWCGTYDHLTEMHDVFVQETTARLSENSSLERWGDISMAGAQALPLQNFS
jgi:hypothetical protein